MRMSGTPAHPRRRRRGWRLCAAAMALVAGNSTAAEYGVRSAAELSRLLQRVVPGDTVLLEDGVWRDQVLRFEADGSEGAPVTLRARTPGRVVLTGASRIEISGRWLVVEGLRFEGGFLQRGQQVVRFSGRKGEATHSRLTQSSVVGYNPPDPDTRYHWVSLHGSHNRVDHNRFEGQRHSGTTVVVVRGGGRADEHVIERNHFVDRAPGGGNGFETIRIGSSDSDAPSRSGTRVENNLFERTDGEIEAVSVKASGNVIRANTFRQVAGTVTLRHGSSNVVEGNHFLGEHGAGTGGVRVMGSGHRVADNRLQALRPSAGAAITLYCGQPDAGEAGNEPVRDVTIEGNVVVDAGPAIKLDAGCGTLGRSVVPVDVRMRRNQVDGLPPDASDARPEGRPEVRPLTAADVGPSWLRGLRP